MFKGENNSAFPKRVKSAFYSILFGELFAKEINYQHKVIIIMMMVTLMVMSIPMVLDSTLANCHTSQISRKSRKYQTSKYHPKNKVPQSNLNFSIKTLNKQKQKKELNICHIKAKYRVSLWHKSSHFVARNG